MNKYRQFSALAFLIKKNIIHIDEYSSFNRFPKTKKKKKMPENRVAVLA